MVSRAQIACDIVIRTLDTHQIFDQGFGIRKYNVQLYGEIQCTVLQGRRNTVYSSTETEEYSVQFYWDRNRIHANYYCHCRTYPKNRLPASY